MNEKRMTNCSDVRRMVVGFRDTPLMVRPNLLHPAWLNDPIMQGLPLTPTRFYNDDDEPSELTR
jgi:hypothetical protein